MKKENFSNSQFSVEQPIRELLESNKTSDEVEKEARDIISESLHQYYIAELESELDPTITSDPIGSVESFKTEKITSDSIEKNFLSFKERIKSEQKLKFIEKLAERFPLGNFYIVGGLTRDGLLGKSSKDIDLVINGIEPDILAAALSEMGRVELVGKNFGVYKFYPSGIDEDDFEQMAIDIAIPRKEKSLGTGRRQDFDVQSDYKLSIEEDLLRRDLTINAMAYDIISDKLIDPFNGVNDLLDGVIKMVDNPDDRISEDLSRMLRVIRFAVKFGFKIDKRTWDSLKENMPKIIETDEANKQVVPWEIIGEELKKSFVMDPVRTLDLLNESGGLHYLLPEVENLKKYQQSKEHHQEGDVYTHTRFVLKSLPPNSPMSLIFAGLFHDVGKQFTYFKNKNGKITFYGHDQRGAELAEKICQRFKFIRAMTDKICLLVRKHMQPFQVGQMKDSTIYKLFIEELPQELLRLHQADILACLSFQREPYNKAVEKIREFQEEENDVSKIKPLIGGQDLISLGFKPGKEFMIILEKAFERQMAGKIRDKKSLLREIRGWPVPLVVGSDLRKAGINSGDELPRIISNLFDLQIWGNITNKQVLLDRARQM